MTLSSDDRALLALQLAEGIGPKTVQTLLEHFKSPAAVLDASVDRLCQIPYMRREVAGSLKQLWTRGDVDAELALMAKHKVQMLRRDELPAPLREIPGAPWMLYVRGEILPADLEAVAIVGSRGCTTYGRRIAHRLAYDLAKAGYTIVSGLARGIDACAHTGALEAGGRTIAVLANGLSRVYPPEHAELADRVAESGALLSEACMSMAPMPGMFDGRNRIISGLGRAVVVVEAGAKSGALLTTRHAAEQGREVYAVPGNVDSVASAGSLELLRNGARMIRGARDLIEDLRGIAPLVEETAAPRKPKMDAAASAIWDALAEPQSIDDLCRLTGEPIAALAGRLMTMELQGTIKKLPGNLYERG